jgi:hypothetical protein
VLGGIASETIAAEEHFKGGKERESRQDASSREVLVVGE